MARKRTSTFAKQAAAQKTWHAYRKAGPPDEPWSQAPPPRTHTSDEPGSPTPGSAERDARRPPAGRGSPGAEPGRTRYRPPTRRYVPDSDPVTDGLALVGLKKKAGG